MVKNRKKKDMALVDSKNIVGPTPTCLAIAEGFSRQQHLISW
jgi:hypothetical protein